METFTRGLQILLAVFLIETFLMNIYGKNMRLPGDLQIDKFGFRIYIPFISAILLTIIVTLLTGYLVPSN